MTEYPGDPPKRTEIIGDAVFVWRGPFPFVRQYIGDLEHHDPHRDARQKKRGQL